MCDSSVACIAPVIILELFNNYVTHRRWVGLSVFRDVA